MTAASAQFRTANDFAPASLTELDHWCLWRYVGHDNRKVPFQLNGEPASSTDVQTWTSFQAVYSAWQKNSEHWAGIAFFFNETDPYAGIDFDDCLDDARQVKLWVQPILEKLCYDTYIEASPSGHGLKAFVRGKLAKNIPGFGIGDGQIELYDHARFFTITGRRFNNAPLEVEEHQEILDWLCELEKGKARTKSQGKPEPVKYVERYVAEVLKGECDEVQAAAIGSQNITLNRAAFNLGRLTGADHLNYVYAKDRLLTAGLAMQNDPKRKPWTRQLLLKVIEAGLRAGILQPRKLVQGEPETASGFDWQDPLPLANSLPAVEPFDLQLLPAAFRPLVEDLAERMQVSYDFVAIPLVVAYAAAVGRRAQIQPKAVDSTWRVVPNLWGGIVAPPGYMKTPAIMAATSALQEVERDGASEYQAAQVDYEEEKQHHELRVNAWKQRATQSYKSGNLVIPSSPGTEPVAPVRKRFITNDATAEALHQILSGNPGGVLNMRDELSGWLAQLDKPGREGDRAFWLEAWKGNGSYTMDRIGRGSIRTEACCVSVLGGIQPGRLRSYLVQALNDAPGNDGLMQRFQLLVWPDLNGHWTYLDRLPNKSAKDAVTEIFRCVVQMNPAIPKIYLFTPEAQDLFMHWVSELEAQVRGNDLHPALISHLAKYRSLMPSLAMLFETTDGLSTDRVSLDHARQGAMWCDYLRPHAERLYSCITSALMQKAQDLASKIKAEKLGKDSFSLRDLYLKQWAGLDTPEAARPAVEVLIDANWVRAIETPAGPKGGRPPETYSINPKVFHDK